MNEFVSSQDYYRFEVSVTREARYIHSEAVRRFIETLLATSETRRDSIEKGAILYRAQQGNAWRKERDGDEEYEESCALPEDRMVPKAEFVGHGRVNPTGIPCLYMATCPDTAMAEVRPWIGSPVSLAQFKVMRDLAVVNCSREKKGPIVVRLHSEETHPIPPGEREKMVWTDIGRAFSTPVTADQAATRYVPTQILAEAFRSHGYDGIVYKSLLADGLNIAVFDCKAAELINCGLYNTESVSFKFEQVDNPYFVSKHYPALRKTPQWAIQRLMQAWKQLWRWRQQSPGRR